MSEKNSSRSMLSFVLSLAIHGVLVGAALFATYDMVVPEGVVTTIEYTSDQIAQGQVDGTLAPASKPAIAKPKVVKAKPKPKPAPKLKAKPAPKPVAAEESEIPVPVAMNEPTEEEADRIIDEVLEEPKELSPNENEVIEDSTDVAQEEEDFEPIAEDPDIAPEALPAEVAEDEVSDQDLVENGTEEVSADGNETVGLPDKAASSTPIPPPAGMHGGMPLYTEGQLKPIANPKFVYPNMSRFLKEEGVVRMRAYFDENGVMNKIEIYDSSGFERLDVAAAQGAQTMRFKALGTPFVYDFGTKWALNGNVRYLENRAVEKFKQQQRRASN